jgi:hypothetical protein
MVKKQNFRSDDFNFTNGTLGSVAGLLHTLTYTSVKNDKRDDLNFPIVNFPFICSNIPTAPVYGVYISQMIRYSRACHKGPGSVYYN